MFLDQRSFEDESFDFVIGDNEFDIGDFIDQFFGLNAIAEITSAP